VPSIDFTQVINIGAGGSLVIFVLYLVFGFLTSKEHTKDNRDDKFYTMIDKLSDSIKAQTMALGSLKEQSSINVEVLRGLCDDIKSARACRFGRDHSVVNGKLRIDD